MKQAIVIRHDLHMRQGKAIAQGAHASGMPLLCAMVKGIVPEKLHRWVMEYGMSKIVLRVESEQELLDIQAQAIAAGLDTHLITDAGRTEFHGVATNTALSIGPDDKDLIDSVTRHLKLL